MGLTTGIFLPVALFVIMFSLGLGLELGDFRRIFVQPRDFLVGMVSQVLLLPAFAFAIALAWAPAPAVAVGLMIIAAAPGGVTSHLLTRYARGDVALSVTLTAVTSLAAIVTVPLDSAASCEGRADGIDRRVGQGEYPQRAAQENQHGPEVPVAKLEPVILSAADQPGDQPRRHRHARVDRDAHAVEDDGAGCGQ